MQIHIYSDNHVDLYEDLLEQWKTEITATLERFSDWIPRVEVQLTDENSRTKGGSDDIRCMIEARPAGRQSVSVEVRAASISHGIREGTNTLERRLDSLSDRARTQARKQPQHRRPN